MLLRAVFWFSMVLMLIPVKNDRLSERSNSVSRIEAFEIINSIVKFSEKMCGEQQLPCEETQELAVQLAVTIFEFGAATPEIAENIAQLIISDQEKPASQ